MKTKIITLESHDDLISVRDKLSWAKTSRILLVWPKYEKVALRLLDLKVLQRHADSLGAHLGLVTRRMNVRRDAESLGIPVFKTTISAQKDPWPDSAPRTQRTPKPPKRDLRAMRNEVLVKEPAWRTSLLGRVVTFSAGVLAVLVMAGLFVPRAAVTLYPEAYNASIVIPVSAETSKTSVSLTGEIPARSISITVSAEGSVPVTSQISIPKNKARGVVQFTNLGPDEILIPAGTVVAATSLIRFVTLNDTRLPAGVDEIVEVRIEALEPGEQANLEIGEIEVVEGPLGLSITVSNPEPTTGGTNARVIGADDNDRTALREFVLGDLKAQAMEQTRSQIGTHDLLLEDTFEIVEIQREEFSPPVGEAGTTLALSIQAEFTAHYILADDLNQLAASAVNASIPQGFSAFGEMTFTLLDTPATDSSGVTYFQLEATQMALRNVDALTVFNLIRGVSLPQAQTDLQETLVLRDEPQIAITPAWWKWLPLIPFNISVEVK
ncbi:MAG: baseplate J/gp47 family protein [Anaerolineales bacterium]|nr:baseplate J/gp47 family protein [Anaerolineales bacterium]